MKNQITKLEDKFSELEKQQAEIEEEKIKEPLEEPIEKPITFEEFIQKKEEELVLRPPPSEPTPTPSSFNRRTTNVFIVIIAVLITVSFCVYIYIQSLNNGETVDAASISNTQQQLLIDKTQAITPTLDYSIQDPPPGGIIPAGTSFSRAGIFVVMNKDVHIRSGWIEFTVDVFNERDENYTLSFKRTDFSLTDNLGTEYERYFQGISGPPESFMQGTINGGNHQKIYVYKNHGIGFEAPINPSATKLIFSIKEIAGIKNLNWEYDLR